MLVFSVDLCASQRSSASPGVQENCQHQKSDSIKVIHLYVSVKGDNGNVVDNWLCS